MAKPWAMAFYASKEWKAARAAALRRDQYTCCQCGGHAEEVHHVIELTTKNINDPMITLRLDNLQSLCHDCHTRETQRESDVAAGYVFDKDGNVVPTKGER